MTKYQLAYRNGDMEDIECDGMQTSDRFTMFVNIDKIQAAGDESQQPTATPILIVHNDEIRSIRNVTSQVQPPPLSLVT